MFRGSFEHSLDQKGRVNVPAKFRELILGSGNPQVVVTRYIHDRARCLDVYPITSWERFEKDFTEKNPRFARNVIAFENFYLGNAHTCEIDGQGRVLLPPSHREWAALEKEVVFSGARDIFRIWPRSVWATMQENAEAAVLDPEFLSTLNL